MKKIILSITLLFTILSLNLVKVNAQCWPNTIFTTPGIYPDSADNLPPAVATVFYETVINVVVPVDTVMGGFTIPIDSIGIVSFSGLPAGFSWASNSPSNYWHGGAKGCVVITGNPTTQQIGDYPLVISVIGKGGGLALPYTVDYYKISIIDSVNADISDFSGTFNFNVSQNTPNPFFGKTEINISSPGNEYVDISVINLIGKEVYNTVILTHKGNNTVVFNAGNLPGGIYMYKVNNNKQTITKRMLIQNR